MRVRMRLYGAAVAALGLVATAGGSDAATAEPTRGGELVIALAEEPDALDPTLARTLVGRMVFVNMCEKLYDVDGDLEVVPQLAADLPEVSDDGLTVTITLRDDVTFNDGTPMDAESVKISLDRHRELDGSARASELALVEEVTVVDPMTVELALSEPFAPLTATLADRAGMIMSPAQLDELGEDFAQNPVCVGPFEFSQRVAQDRIVLERAENYYDADEVLLDRIVFLVIVDGPVRTANLRSGDIDMAERLQPTDAEAVEDDADLQLFTATSIGYQGITVNVGRVGGATGGEPGTVLAEDPRLLEAFELSLDRDLINQLVFDGQFVPGCSPISPVSPFAVDITCPERDLEAAQALIEEAGVATPVDVELLVTTGTENVRLGEVIQSMANEAGFNVSVQVTEFAAALDETEAGNYETFQIGWSGRIDPDGNVHTFHHSAGDLNISGLADPDLDELLDQARIVTDPDERKSLYAEIVEQLHERRNIIYLYHQNLFVGAQANIAGFEFFADGLPRLKSAGFVE